MKKLFFKGCSFSLALLISAVLSYADVTDKVPKEINVQGKLTTDSGQPVTGSGKIVSLYIFDSESGTQKAKITNNNVTLDSDGLYSVNFDISGKDLDFTNKYSFKVEANGVMSSADPIQFAASPYSFHSSTATYALVLSPGGEKLVDDNFNSSVIYKIKVDTSTYAISASSITISGASGQVWGMNGNAQGWIDPGSLSIAPATVDYIGGLKLKNTATGLGMMNDGSVNSILKVNLDSNSGLEIDSSNNIKIKPATASTFGVVKVPTANGLSVNSDGQVSVAKTTGSGYGVVQIGSNIDVMDGVISLKKGSSSDFGLVKTDGQTITASDGVISVNKDNITVSSAAYAQKDYAGHIIASYYQQAITGGATTITSADLTASKALVSNSSGKVAVSGVTSTELGYLSGVTSSIQTQLGNKQASLTEAQLAAANSGITAAKVTTYDGYASGKQDALTETQLAAVNSGITAAKVTTYDGYASGKQDALTETQLAAANSGITAAKVTTYDGYATSKQDTLSGNLSGTPTQVWATNGTSQGWVDLQDITVGTGKVINADLAEIYKSTEDLQPGDVVSIDTTRDDAIVKTRTAEDTLVAGVISTEPGLLLNSAEKGYKLALVGKVPTKVCNEGGEIKRGDLLVSASIAGYAKKAGDNPKAGTVIGKALENFSSKRGTILVLVNLQ